MLVLSLFVFMGVTFPETHIGDVSKSNISRPTPNVHDRYELDLSRGAESLNYMKGRFQLPEYGKFNRPDPMRDWNWLAPHTINLYEYVGNDPINKWDPTGFTNRHEIKLKTQNNDITSHPRDSIGRQLAEQAAYERNATDGFIAMGAIAAYATAYITWRALPVIVKYLAGDDDVSNESGDSEESIEKDVSPGEPAPPDDSSNPPSDDDSSDSDAPARQRGERMRDGTAQEAEQQLEEIENAQKKVREKKSGQIIDSTEKSKQRMKHRHKRIDTLEDAEEEYDTFEDAEEEYDH